MNPTRIVVLDDHALIIEAIKSIVEEENSLKFEKGFKKSADLFQYLKNHKNIDIILLDIQLEGEDGIEVCKKLQSMFPYLKILMLSSNTQGTIVMDALKKGAKGFLPKNISLEDLVEACKAVMDHKTYIHKDISFTAPIKHQSQYAYVPNLTRREKEVLSLIMEELTSLEIANKLCLTVSTVETHRSSLFIKTGSKNVVGLIKFTLEKGLLE